MSLIQWIREEVGERLSALHRGQGGAVAIMVLAALLIVFMISLVIYDTGKVARDKLEVQAAAETAAWSHTAVEARSMNTIAFANVGKKLIISMNAYYESLIKAYVALAAIVVALIIICAIAAVFVGDVCLSKSIEVGLALAEIFAKEGSDIGKFYGSGLKTYFKDDLKAFDNYQTYMASITPWWAWMEGYLRGARNGAMAVGTFPVPKNITSQLLPRLNLGPISLPQASGRVDALPARKVATNSSSSTNCGFFGTGWFGTGCTTTTTHDRSAGARQVCTRLWSSGDVALHALDYNVKTMMELKNTTFAKKWGFLIVPLTSVMAMPFVKGSCEGFFSSGGPFKRYDDEAMPFEIPMPSNAAAWQLATSNLVFAYRPHSALKGVDKSKYNFISRNYQNSSVKSLDLSKDATGSWAMARAEIAFQDFDGGAQPDLWHTNWSSRMRPVSLGNEWSQSGVRFGSAAMDALPYLAAGSLISGISSSAGGGGANPGFAQSFQDMLHDGARLIMSTDALNQGRDVGLPR